MGYYFEDIYYNKFVTHPKMLGDKPKLNITKSEEEYARGQRVIPGGLCGFKAPYAFIPGEYPIYIERGNGSHMWDPDGNEFIDYMGAYGPIGIGFNEAEINEPVFEQICQGFSFDLYSTIVNEAAERFVALVPGAEQVYFAKTGTDVVNMAIKLARAYTHKEYILTDGYHGWGDYTQYRGDAGLPSEIVKGTIKIAYGDIDHYAEEIKKGNVAGVLVNPAYHESCVPVHFDQQFLNEIRRLTIEYDLPLIFDEVRTGFRVTMPGVQKLAAVEADISVYGKAIANGYAISAVAGKAKYMEPIKYGAPKGVIVNSTCFSNTSDLRALIETIKFYEKHNVIQSLWEKGEYFLSELDKLIQLHDIPFYGGDIPVMPSLDFDRKILGEEKFAQCQLTLYTYLIRSGMFCSPSDHFSMMYRHTKRDIDLLLDAIDRGFSVVKKECL